MHNPRTSKDIFVLLQLPSFRYFLITRVLSTGAFQMMSVAIAWEVWDLSKSALSLGMIGLAQFAPKIIFMPFAGNLADRVDRRKILALSIAVQGACMLALAVRPYGGEILLPMIYIFTLVIGAARTYEMPATQALLPALVPSQQVSRAVAISASTFQLSTVFAPMFAGFLYIIGPDFIYALVGALLGIATYSSLKIKPLKDQEYGISKGTAWKSFIEGLNFVRHNRSILGAISLDMMAVLLGGATALLPIIASDVLKTGTWGLGLLRAAPALGAMLISLWLTRYPLEKNVGRWMFGSVIVFGLATVILGLSSSLMISLLALLVVGGADMISMIFRSSYIQLATPDSMRGRVSSVNGLFIGASNQLGEFESGLTAAWIGVVPAIVAGGVGTVVVALIWMHYFPGLANLKTLPKVD